jgi:hypothetical protein
VSRAQLDNVAARESKELRGRPARDCQLAIA